VRVLVCPDKFAGTLSAAAAGEAIADGWVAGAPGSEVTVQPLADGGPGFLDVLASSLPGTRIEVTTMGPLGDPAPGSVLVVAGTGYVESAQACGLHLVPPELRDPKVTTSFGLGALVAAAVEAGAREIVIGLGGSATNDAGAGFLAALGAAPVDRAGYVLPHGGAALAFTAALVGVPRLRGAILVGASDVDSPLTGPRGASAVFGPQKGASAEDVAVLDAALSTYAAVLERDLPGCPVGLAARPGAGAAGGLGAAILATGGRIESGADLVWRATGLDSTVDGYDLVITGEGKFDDQSLRGKVVSGVATAARAHGKPCLVLAGQVSLDPAEARAAGISAHGVANERGVEAALARPAEELRGLAERVARRFIAG
jgi:glycerate kinase